MSDMTTVEGLQAQLVERNRELARLRAEQATWDVAERKRVEEQLRLSEEKARDLIRYAPTGIYEVDYRTSRFRSVNDAMCEILGYSREELLGMPALELLDDDGRALFAERIRRTLMGEQIDPSVEYRVKRKDGSVIYGVLSTRITYQDGQPDSAFVIAHDVTERRRAAEELREQRERLSCLAAEQEAILRSIADGLIVYDVQGQIVRLNDAAKEMLGYTPDQRSLSADVRAAALEPRRADDSPLPPQEQPAARALRGEVVTGEDLILYVPARGGRPLRLAVSSAPIRAAGGRVVGAVTTFTNTEALHAASERLRAANSKLEAQATELREAAEKLEQRVAERTAELTRANQELRYQAIVLASISDAVVATDQNRLITYLNPAAIKQYGWPAEEAMGRNPVHLFGGEFTDCSDEDFAHDLETENRWRGEVVVHRKDGTSFYADATSVTLRDESGRLLGHIGVHHDITERKRLEEVLRAKQEQAQSDSRRLVAAVENEQRNLARELHDQAGQSLSALKLSLAHLRREVDLDGGHSAPFDEMGQLIDSVMDDLHRLALNLRPVSLDRYGLIPALQQYVELCRQQSGLAVDLVTVGVEAQRLPADLETVIYRVAQEALTNVLRHAKAHHVGVVIERQPERVIAIIEDDGQGFDLAEALNCGRLGLLGMRERAEMLGGSLTIESAPGRGTTVFADLPVDATEVRP